MEHVKYFYKQRGMAGNNIRDAIFKQYNLSEDTKIALCGSLDHGAHGLMPYLLNENTKFSEQVKKHSKTYKFSFLVGLESNTSDIYGDISFYKNEIKTEINLDQLMSYINNTKHYTEKPQQYHIYSSASPQEICPKTNKRERSWIWVYHGLIPPPCYHNGQFISKTVNEVKKIKRDELLNYVHSHYDEFKSFTGSNDETKTSWRDVVKSTDTNYERFFLDKTIQLWNETHINQEEYAMITMTVHVSGGFFIRQYVQDLSNELNTKMLVLDIERVSIN